MKFYDAQTKFHYNVWTVTINYKYNIQSNTYK